MSSALLNMFSSWNLHRKIPLADGFRCVQKLLDWPFDFDFSVKADYEREDETHYENIDEARNRANRDDFF